MDPATALAWALLSLAGAAALGLVILIASLARGFARAPRLAEQQASGSDASASVAMANTSLTVVVPAYNEAANIAACLTSVLRSEDPCGDWRVLLVDDRSSDATVAIAQEAAGACGATEPRFSLLDAVSRHRKLDQRRHQK